MEEAVLTIKEAASRARVGPQKIHRDIKAGKLRAYKIGWQWIINEGDLLDYLSKKMGIDSNNS